MKIKQLFTKPIDRTIQGVITIGQTDEENIQQELEEYVVTEELHQYMDRFFTDYTKSITKPTTDIGVWISGFFGSGKSHFLKILSYLLSDQLVNGKSVPDYFKSKVSAQLYEKIMVAHQAPTDVILFNIDSKSPADNKQHKTAIVKIFNKVFNEMRGYSPSLPWLAELEETLERNGEYEAFKTAFESESDLAWEDGREELFYNEDVAVSALSKVTTMSEESARRWIENGEANYELSLDSFAKRIKAYVDTQGDDYRLVFFADEVGQYIAESVSLMLNLQSLSEDIGKYTQGKVWIVVTSQQEIDSLEKSGMAAADFSKIQARYATRLSLSSANADEVIKKRLLDKTEDAKETLALQFDDKEAVLKNALSFTGTVNRTIYGNRDNFAEVYPFIPYQFNLLQTVFTEIRNHSAAGKHLADGERNLLGGVQEAAKQYLEESTDRLVSFDMFYDNLDQALDHSVRSVFIRASQDSTFSPFDLRVLKLLFLVRYVESFQKDVESLATLLINEIDQDRIVLQRDLTKSLEKLQKQYLIQRRGQEYFFLTNEEQDVNREIQNIQVTTSSQVDEIGKEIFDEILEIRRYTHLPFADKRSLQYTFDVAQWIDNRPRGHATAEIGVRILTSFEIETLEEARQLSMRENQVIIVLPEQGTYYEDMESYLKIAEYVRKNSAKSNDKIISDKVREREELSNAIRTQLRKALEEAEYFVHGTLLDTTTNIIGNVDKGLSLLVNERYVKLNYINESVSSEKELITIVENKQESLLENLDDKNKMATDELESYIDIVTQRKMTQSLSELIQKFKKVPFGWKDLDVLASLIWLLKEEKITFTMAGQKMNLLQSEEFVRLITRKPNQERIAVTKREVIADKYIKRARDLSKNLFNVSVTDEKEDEIFKFISTKFLREKEKLEELKKNYQYRSYYPGEKEVERGIKDYQKIVQLTDPLVFFKYLYDFEEDILDTFDDTQPVKQFFDTLQPIFDDAYKVSEQYNRDKNIIESQVVLETGQKIYQIVRVESQPYSKIKQLRPLIMEYKQAFMEELENISKPILERVEESDIILLEALGDDAKGTEYRHAISTHFSGLKKRINYAESISDLNALHVELNNYVKKTVEQINQQKEAEQRESERKRAQLEKLKQTPQDENRISEEDYQELEKEVAQIKEIKRVPVLLNRDAYMPAGNFEIKTEEDIDYYLEQIKKNLQSRLKDGNTLKLL